MRLSEISSLSNPHYRRWLSLLESKGIRESGQCLVSGAKLISELILEHPQADFELILGPKDQEIKGSLNLTLESLSSSIRVFRVAKPLFRNLDALGTHAPLLVSPTPETKILDLKQAPQGLEVICPLGDPQNLGALLRSAEAFGARLVALTPSAANPFLPKALRAASGSTFRVPIFRVQNDPTPIASPLIGLDASGIPIENFKWPQDARLWVGEEGQGLPRDFDFAHKISIPMMGKVESLNAAVAASAAMFHFSISRPKT